MQCMPLLVYMVGVSDDLRDQVHVVVPFRLGRSDDKVSDLGHCAEFVECFHLVSLVV